MKRVFVVLAACVAAAFAVDLGAQPPDGGQDRPRGERREGDRDRGDRGDRGGRGERGGRFGGFRMPPNPVVAAIDADDDGELSEQEIKNASKALMALDKNKDGKINAEEMRPQFGPGGGFDPGQFVERMITDNDKNKDGKLSKDELPERMQPGFDRWDTNNDGFAERSEIDEAMRSFRRGPGGRSGRDGGDRPNRDGNRPAPDRPVTSDDL